MHFTRTAVVKPSLSFIQLLLSFIFFCIIFLCVIMWNKYEEREIYPILKPTGSSIFSHNLKADRAKSNRSNPMTFFFFKKGQCRQHLLASDWTPTGGHSGTLARSGNPLLLPCDTLIYSSACLTCSQISSWLGWRFLSVQSANNKRRRLWKGRGGGRKWMLTAAFLPHCCVCWDYSQGLRLNHQCSNKLVFFIFLRPNK